MTLRFILLISFLVFSVPKKNVSWAGTVDCSNYKLIHEIFDNKTHVVREMKNVNVDHIGPTINVSSVFGAEDQLWLGITNKDGHFYLKVGEVMMDSPVVGPWSKLTEYVSNVNAKRGYLIHFPEVSQERLRLWVSNLEGQKKILGSINFHDFLAGSGGGASLKPGWNWSCASGACKELESFGIHLAGTKSLNVMPSNVFKQIMKDGFIDAEGNPVLFDIYRSPGAKSIPMLVKGMKRHEKGWILKVVGIGGVGSIVGTYYIFLKKPTPVLPSPSPAPKKKK